MSVQVRRLPCGLAAAALVIFGVCASHPAQAPVPVIVRTVDLGGPAAVAGLRVGDTIVAVDGAPIGSARDLVPRLAAVTPGASLRLVVLRNGEERGLQLTPAASWVPVRPTPAPVRASQAPGPAPPSVQRRGLRDHLEFQGGTQTSVFLWPLSREKVTVASAEVRSFPVRAPDSALQAWSGWFPAGGTIDPGGGTHLTLTSPFRSVWYASSDSGLRWARGVVAFEQLPDPQSPAALRLEVGEASSVVIRPITRWWAWGLTFWDPDLEVALGKATTWHRERYWGFRFVGGQTGPPLPRGDEATPAKLPGAWVLSARSGFSGVAAGLRAGDRITQADGRAIHNPWDLCRLLADGFPGQETRVVVWRGDVQREVLVRVRGTEFGDIPLEYLEKARKPVPPRETTQGAARVLTVSGPVRLGFALHDRQPEILCAADRIRLATVEAHPIDGEIRGYELRGSVRVQVGSQLVAENPAIVTLQWFVKGRSLWISVQDPPVERGRMGKPADKPR